MIDILCLNYDSTEKLMCAETKKIGHIMDYLEIMVNSLAEMFEYTTDLFTIVDINNIETILRTWGTVGFAYDKDGKLFYGYAYCGGKRNRKGIGDKVTIQLLSGECYTKSLDECVLGFNNTTRSSDRILYWFAKQFCETDISQVNNVNFSRQAPIFVAKNNKVKQFISNIFKKIRNGELCTIADDSILQKGEKLIDTVNLTDVTSIDKLQYLDTYHNGLLRRIYTLFGMPLAEGMKQAQQTEEEVTSNADSSKIIPLNNLKMRKEMCKELAEFTGHDISVEFSELMRQKVNSTDTSERSVIENGEI